MSTWEERMAERAKARREAQEVEERRVRAASRHASTNDWHLHGTWTVCPCGAETGITTVAFTEGWEQPDPCPDCGKPVAGFGNTYPWRRVETHALGCREHPDTGRCDYCSEPMIGASMWTVEADGTMGSFHFGCSPESETWDPDAQVWRDRTGAMRRAT